MVNPATVFRAKCDCALRVHMPKELWLAVRRWALAHGYSNNRAVIVLLTRQLQEVGYVEKEERAG